MSRAARLVAVVLTAIAVAATGLVPATAAPSADTAAAAVTKRKKPRTAPSTTCATSQATPGAETRARLIWVELRLAGYSPAATAGVLGVLDFRSSLAPMAIARSWGGYGIAQWTPARWATYASWVESSGSNRWNLKRQAQWLVREMATDPETFDHTAFAQSGDAAAAAKTFRNSYFGTTGDPAAVAAMQARAGAWLAQLAGKPLVRVDATVTNGQRVACAPASGAVIDRCPMVPQSFRDRFRSFTGFAWGELDANARFMTRCVYVNFPFIQNMGTYNGHMPSWRQAIDFFLPSGCAYRNGRAVSRDREELAAGRRLARYLITHSDKIGLDYAIFQDRIRNPDEHSNEGYWTRVSSWRKDNYNNGDCVNTHFDHLHASVYRSTGWAAGVREPALNPDGRPW